MPDKPATDQLSFSRLDEDQLIIHIKGRWHMSREMPSSREVIHFIENEQGIRGIQFETAQLTEWDSGLLVFLMNTRKYCSERKIQINTAGLPKSVNRLLSFAAVAAESENPQGKQIREPIFEKIGRYTLSLGGAVGEIFHFIGGISIAFFKIWVGHARFRRSDIITYVKDCGAGAFPIVSLISFLVGLILAFVGAIQLKLFGVQIYVASLVGIAMIRVMGAIMTGIIMAGRTGASFAAELGSMQVNEEIDALKTMGISPVEFLVLPRVLALSLMMPLLCLYADFMGILGGLVVGVGMLDLNLAAYLNQTQASVNLTDLWVGLFHSLIFGVLVSSVGCLRGLQCGRSASDVGTATTSAVVTGIVCIIVTTAIITVICEIIGI